MPDYYYHLIHCVFAYVNQAVCQYTKTNRIIDEIIEFNLHSLDEHRNILISKIDYFHLVKLLIHLVKIFDGKDNVDDVHY